MSRICHFCGRSEKVGGAFIDHKNPVHFRHRKEGRGYLILTKEGGPPMHALCKLLEMKGFYLDKEFTLHKVKNKYGEY
tara:strand:+ start:44 stop:277 length:234 start_codon:yes stop_codon:yes gene_type:complete